MKEKIENWIDDTLYDILYDINSVKVEQFDYSYLDMIDFILMEKFGVDEGTEKYRKLLHLSGLNNKDSKKDLLNKFQELGIDESDYSPQHSSEEFKVMQEYKIPSAWTEAEGLVAEDNKIDKINDLQKEYSIQSKGYKDKTFYNLARPETGDVWTPLIKQLLQENVLNGELPGLTIGCRWAGEVEYFRSLGLSKMMGMDLFSRYPNLVEIGDMHNMKYPDNHFGIIYQRNTFDKSYDIRKAIGECLRTLNPGGILIYDDVQNYTCGVNELARSNVVCNKWVLQYLNVRNNVEGVLYNQQTPCDWQYCNFIGQLAVKIRK